MHKSTLVSLGIVVTVTCGVVLSACSSAQDCSSAATTVAAIMKKNGALLGAYKYKAEVNYVDEKLKGIGRSDCAENNAIPDCAPFLDKYLAEAHANIDSVIEKAVYSVSAIRTIKKDDSTGNYFCVGIVSASSEYGDEQVEKQYKVEPTSDGQAYVTVF